MKSAKKFFTLLFFSIAAAITGCSEPVGSLLYSVDYIKAVPHKILYEENVGNLFLPADDVTVIGVFGGVEEEIDIDKVVIHVINDPGYAGSYPPELVPDNRQVFPLSYGIKEVVITYNNMNTSYRIAVGLEGTNPSGGWGGGGAGIIINW